LYYLLPPIPRKELLEQTGIASFEGYAAIPFGNPAAITKSGRSLDPERVRECLSRPIVAHAVGALSAVFALLLFAGCAPNPPRLYGEPGASPRPESPWKPPQQALKAERDFAAGIQKSDSEAAIPKAYLDHLQKLSLSEIVAIGLLTNTQTRQAWASARAAAAAYGSKEGAYLPTITGSLAAGRQKTASPSQKNSSEATSYSAGLNLNWLLFDWGGRSASVEEAREALMSADWSHNGVVQNVILEVEQACYEYAAAKALANAQQATVDESRINLRAAEERDSAGLATLADVLQARTALSQAILSLETLQGRVMTTRGALSTAMGLSADLPFDVDFPVSVPPLDSAKKSVKTYLDAAMLDRPDLAAAWAQARQAQAHVRTVRAQALPPISLTGNLGEVSYNDLSHGNDVYGISLGVAVPIFSGFSHHYDIQAARAQAEAAAAGALNSQKQVVLEVWTDYYNFQTADQQVRTSDDLFASATQNQEVAAGRYKSGVGSILDLLTAQAALASARAQQIQSRAGWWMAAAQLSHDTGGLSAAPAATGKDEKP